MAKPLATEIDRVNALLKGAFGDFTPKQTLGSIFKKAPAFGRFEWMLTILAIEIDLRVDIPERTSDNHRLSVEDFVTRVAKLPKVESKTYTLDSLVLLAQALLTLESDEAPSTPKANKPSESKAATKPTKKPSRKARSRPSAPKKPSR